MGNRSVLSSQKLETGKNDKDHDPIAQYFSQEDKEEKDASRDAHGTGSDKEGCSQARDARKDKGDRSPALKESFQPLPALALELIQSYLIHDPDHYVRERTWKTLPRLATSHPEEVRKSCLTLFRLAA